MLSASQERSLAEAELAAGRPALASSFRFHRPRGPICGRGYCSSCEVQADEGRVLACRTPAPAGFHRRRDVLRPLGRVAERWPPWFYERRFLRVPALANAALEALRRASAAGRLSGRSAPPSPRDFAEIEAATVVVGASLEDEDALVVDAAAGDVALGVYRDRVLGALYGGRLVAVRFERIVLATGGYERLPPVRGNDLPGVIGLHALAGWARSLRPGTRLAVWGPRGALARAGEIALEHELEVVWADEQAPEMLSGRGRVERVHAGGAVRCDLFVVGVAQPALELALQAGAAAELTSGELPILAARELPPWLELRGAAAAQSSGVPDVVPDDDAFACLCEDVRVADIRACVAQGFADAELVKRRTGAMTGPCQGKLCAASVLAVLRAEGVAAAPTTARPPARPVTLAELSAHA